MPTLRRILKYTPAVMLGLLVVAWVSTAVCFWWFVLDSGKRIYSAGFMRGSVFVGVDQPPMPVEPFVYGWHSKRTRGLPMGKFKLEDELITPTQRHLHFRLPIPVVLAALLPLAVGTLVSFRFRLWHYLAYTALVAFQLAYYLRWQE